VLSGVSVRPKNVWMPWSVTGWKRGSFSMNIQPDFEDFLRLLETHRVDYMIVVYCPRSTLSLKDVLEFGS